MSHFSFIFDLDGTLYPYKDGKDFASSDFYQAIRRNIGNFLQNELGIPTQQVEETYQRLKSVSSGHVSLAIEREYGVPREHFFEQTWNLDPASYIERNEEALLVLTQLSDRSVVLTEAPRVWAEAALNYLGVYPLIVPRIFTGEPDIRKPSTEAFTHVCHTLGMKPEQTFSVGDQEQTDILPAKQACLRTIRLGGKQTSADFHIKCLGDLLRLPVIDSL